MLPIALFMCDNDEYPTIYPLLLYLAAWLSMSMAYDHSFQLPQRCFYILVYPLKNYIVLLSSLDYNSKQVRTVLIPFRLVPVLNSTVESTSVFLFGFDYSYRAWKPREKLVSKPTISTDGAPFLSHSLFERSTAPAHKY